MDGRCQAEAISLAKATFGVDAIDNITEPGIDGILAGADHPLLSSEKRTELVAWIRDKAGVSVNGHQSTQALITGHCDCKGNPVDLESHMDHLRAARLEVMGWGIFAEVRTAVFDEKFGLKILD
jgi:hypothetical protein